MPPQPANANPKKFSGIEAAAIIGLAAVMDFVQFIGEWVFLGLFPVIGSTVAFVATLGLATGVGTAVGTALGLFVGSIFGFFISTLAGVILSLWFHLKGVRFAGKLGAAAIVEMVPYANSLPGWTIAAAVTVSQANGGVIGRLAGTFLSPTGLLTAVSGGTAAATAGAGAARAQATARAAQQNTERQEVRASQQSIDGIRPANDNATLKERPRLVA
jgi:hypothetical protein